MQFSVATISIKSLSPYSQSRQHSEPKFEKESPDAYDRRTWLSKAHIGPNGTMVIPSNSMHQAISAAAQYGGQKIKGRGTATYTARFRQGTTITADIDLGIPKEEIGYVDIGCDAKGKKGSAVSSRVQRRFPQVPSWEATFEIWVLDPIVTEEILREAIAAAGLFVGIGRWRPIMNGGSNGRFSLVDLTWEDNRRLAA